MKNTLLALYKDKIAAGSPTEPSTTAADVLSTQIFNMKLTTLQATRIYSNLDDRTVGDIIAAYPRDFISLKYLDGSRAYNFEDASPGQQASALLELLLNQSAGTLIIDQPEDDLDNRVIMDIVRLIRTSKSRRQLVFTTHNPNIVVNGDADKVIALSALQSTPGQAEKPQITIDVDGAIETLKVRKAITHIIEGGKDAFDLRSRKYNFGLKEQGGAV